MNFDWAIIGTGFIYPRHKQAIEDNGGKVVATYNTKNDWREVLKSDVPNVAICTPNDLHYEMALECLKAGKRVLIEKPPVLNMEQFEELVGVGNLYVVLQLRYHPIVQTLKTLVKHDNEAKIDIHINRDKSYWDGWKGDVRRSGGVIWNIGSHYFDILLHCLGGQPAKIEYKIDLSAPKNDQWRFVTLNGYQFNFSSKDNLSYEGLHFHVYKEIKEGRGIKLSECESTIRFLCSLEKENENKNLASGAVHYPS